jgi:hypothetical protein
VSKQGPTMYVVTMKRWGQDETHHYLLGVFSTSELAHEMGEKEKIYRGGKYQLEVTPCQTDNIITDSDYAQEAMFPRSSVNSIWAQEKGKHE